MRLRAIALAVLLPAAAAAQSDFPNDVRLFELGHPQPILADPTASGCPPTCPGENGDPTAQTRFGRLASELGIAITPRQLAPAESLGDAGFEVSASFDLAFVGGRTKPEHWRVESGNPPDVLFIPTIRARKGLPFSTELGLDIGYIIFTQYVPATLTVKASLVEGFKFIPDVAVRGFATHLIGARDFDLTTGGFDISISKAFGILGMFNLTPYLGWSSMWLHAATGSIDFKPTRELDGQAGHDDDSVFYEMAFGKARFDRVFGGLRIVSYVLSVTFAGEYTFATGIPDGHPTSGATFSVAQLGLSAKLGVDF